ncbi:bifunctional metallophosphatase/5'-nucleotidase [Nostoc piscinale]|uniref:bifunctional metallophosphatase/5'-nucleotidase n=1 Tax=Nostoc piscinale TaxID=224012 RepID=UPI0039A6B274
MTKIINYLEKIRQLQNMKLLSPGCSIVLQILVTFTFTTPVFAEVVNINLLQLNDVYEITPVEGGTRGGLARVATVRKQLRQANPRTYTILAGDFLSPSALGTAKINGTPLAGQQMVAVLNALGLDYATFGNHEFDLPENSFYQRLQESGFRWFSGNVSDSKGQPFKNVPRSIVFNVKGDRGAVVRVGLIGLTLDSNKANYVSYTDPLTVAKQQVAELKGKVDILVAVTHLSIESDRILAETIPEIDLILGGHEHENIQQWRGRDFTPIFKADANARTIYIHQLRYDTTKRNLQINSRLMPITDKIPDEPKTAQVVKQWLDKGFTAFRANGFEPNQEVAKISFPLDGLESSVRNKSTELTKLIAEAMLQEVPNADLAIFNGGSIRVDDVILPGSITQYDVIRILPFGGKVVAVEMKGELLARVLKKGQENKGTGGYLQTAQVTKKEKPEQWLINGQPLDTEKFYKVAISDFLISGKERGLDFLNLQNPDIKLISEKRDIRFVVIDQLKKQANALTR